MLFRWRQHGGLLGLHGASCRFAKSERVFPRSYEYRCFKSCFLAVPPTKAICTTAQPRIEPPRRRRKDTIPTADTIYALSTAPGRAAIAVVRVSGPACLDVYGALCPERPFPHPRTATLRRLKDPKESTRVLDTGALVLYFPAPHTVTGDDVLELHVHGGPAVVRSVLEAIPRCTESRPRRRTADYSLIRAAEPGEFTKRAFYNGRLDLTQAEALGETLAAETEQQRRLAVAGVDSRLATRYEEWRKVLMYARGELEALIDFSEDQHFDDSPADFVRSVSAQVSELSRQIKLHIHNASRGELLRNGISISLLGPPNAGKSSLLNLIAGRDAAIVSAEAGTTRDIVDVTIDIDGWLVRLGDMAGLRSEAKDGLVSHVDARADSHAIGQVEREGIRRARERALRSDLVIIVVTFSQNSFGAMELEINPELVDAVEQCRKADKAMVFVINKVDLLPSREQTDTDNGLRQRMANVFPGAHQSNIYLVSCKDASSSSSPILGSPVPESESSDPGGVQTFLQGLSHAFTTMTAVTTESDPLSPSIVSKMTPAEAHSYWSASLSITHRQSKYLQSCQTHLDDFLAQCSTPRLARVPAATVSSHHVDGHHDLIGEKSPDAELMHGDVEEDFDIVTAAEHLRYAANCLARITGRGEGGDVEDVLGVVFEKFCVGK